MTERYFGELADFPEGYLFQSRSEMFDAGVHRERQAGISGSGKEGAESIVLSGGYEDDRDFGDIVVYTGHGGRDEKTSQQVSDQLFTRGNLALAVSCQNGLPVRVIRGSGHRSRYTPKFGYRYDGLYRVERYWRERGKSGYIIWRYRLVKVTPEPTEEPSQHAPVKKVTTVIQRIVRDTAKGRSVKQLYGYRCQICDWQLIGAAGPYAEAAHVRPLGSPHNGADTVDNILCLCPNHHVLLDYGGIAISDDLTLLGMPGQLTIKKDHTIAVENLRYHRAHFFKGI